MQHAKRLYHFSEEDMSFMLDLLSRYTLVEDNCNLNISELSVIEFTI